MTTAFVRNSLPKTLQDLLNSGAAANPPLNRLLEDYRNYHVVFVVVSAMFTVACGYLSVQMFRQRRRVASVSTPSVRLERRIYLVFAALGCIVALVFAVLLAANVSNVVNPRRGLADSVSLIGTPAPGSYRERVQQAFSVWLNSGGPQRPDLVDRAINDRLAWQRPKAVWCSLLLVAFAIVGVRIWRTVIRRTRVRGTSGGLIGVGLLVSGVGVVVACLVLMVMVIGNTQGALAPLSLTLIFG